MVVEFQQLFESLAIRTEHQLKRLFKFTQGAAHLWDIHEIGLAKQERRLQDDLDESRQVHDVDNQERESKLDVVMDRLRQESTEEALSAFLQKSLEMLDYIYEGYEEFNAEQLKHVTNYPEMVRNEVKRYDEAVCQFFNVDRRRPSARRQPPGDEETVTEPTERERKSPTPNEEKVLRDTVRTEKGTPFYVSTVADKEDFKEEGEREETTDAGGRLSGLSDSAFLTEIADDSGTRKMPEYLSNVYLETSTLRNLKKCVRMQFLNHLEEWTERSQESAQTSARNKKDELASELDLRKHLHNPRAKRIELDVHNVRAAELVLHKERVSRHCKGISAALIGLKQDFDEITKEHDSQALGFRSKIEGMEDIFINATKSAKLVVLTNSLHGELDKYMQVVKASLRQFRQMLDNTLGKLRDANAQCLKSFKLFSQGGNFSPDETVGLRRKLEKMSQRVDAAEGVIMQDLEGMESRRLDHASEVVNKFEDK